MLTNLNLVIYQGANYSGRLNAVNSDGSYMNLTGLTGRGLVRYQYSSSGNILDLNPIIHSSYISGIIDVVVNYTGTTGIPITLGYYDIEVFKNDFVDRVFQGRVDIVPNYTA